MIIGRHLEMKLFKPVLEMVSKCNMIYVTRWSKNIQSNGKIPESLIKKSDSCVKSNKTFQQNSYWPEVYGIVGVEVYSESNPYRTCDKYWFHVRNKMI